MGGHSGAEIDKNRANANKLMGRFLYGLKKKAEYAIISLTGGQKDNAITRECTAEFLTDSVAEVKACLLYTSPVKKKRYPTYKRKYKRKKQLRRKILTTIILCVILAVCNGWMPPRSLKEVKDQSRIFGQVFLTYIEENAQILWEDISESASDAVTGLLKQSQTKTGGQTESVSLDQIPEYSGSPYVEINRNVPSFSDEKSAGPAYEFYSELDSLGRCGYACLLYTSRCV